MELLNYLKMILMPECRLFWFVIYTILDVFHYEQLSPQRVLVRLFKAD
jgi:hypothetical protein